ncbi:MAG: molecular chaperone HtpG [Chlamydiales bacterium]|nr:molecular chaperone HtpG [Chlamydiales bacterium]
MGKLKIHTENLLPIIKKWLYSDKDIFVRELISNSCDALHKLRILRERGEAEFSEESLRIDLIIDKEGHTLKFVDTGIGMSEEEVEKYISQIAFSGAEEFLDKYKSQNEQDQIIGHFGLGFYSAYMVSTKVEIDTLSYRPSSAAVLWSCDGSSEYSVAQGERAERGTEITLFIDKDSDEFLEESKIKQILKQYCAFLPFPIYLNGEKINHKDPLWLKNASECTDKEYLDFYRDLYPQEPDPIFWIHLNVDYPFNLKGILYFPRVQRRFDWNRANIKLFCNRVFVSDNCKDLIPEYLAVLQGALDSADIPLNVSRSTLQMDKTVRQLASHISKKVSDRLTSLHLTEKVKFQEAWPDIELIVKLGAVQDEKFYERVKGALIWKNTEGEWTTAEEYLERNREKTKEKIFYTTEEKTPSYLLELYKGHEVLYATSPVDTALMNTLENKLSSAKFQRLDGAIEAATLDSSREKTLLDADGKTQAGRIADFIRASLGLEKVEVEAKSLTSDTLPAFIVLDEEARRMRDYMALTGQSLPFALTDKKTFVVNTNSKLISSIYAMQSKQPDLAKQMVRHVYDLSLLSQKELEPTALADFVSRSSSVLEQLIEK